MKCLLVLTFVRIPCLSTAIFVLLHKKQANVLERARSVRATIPRGFYFVGALDDATENRGSLNRLKDSC